MGKPKGHPGGKRKRAGHRKDGQKTGSKKKHLKGSVQKRAKKDAPVAMDAEAQVGNLLP